MKNTITLAVFIAIGLFQVHGQNTITVDNSEGSSAQFSDLQSAIFSAEAGDTLYIHASETDYGNVTMNKALTLIGFAHSDVDKRSAVSGIALDQNTSGSTFNGLLTNILQIGDAEDITLLNDITVENCRIDDIQFRGPGVDNLIIRGNIVRVIGTISNFAILNNFTNTIITNNIITGVISVRNHQSVIIKNNLFLNSFASNTEATTGTLTVQNCIFYTTGTSIGSFNVTGLNYENCLVYSPRRDYDNLEGTNNIDNIDPLFVNDIENPTTFDPLTDDFNLQEGSLAIGAGVSGENIGLYDDSGFTFNNFGYTVGLPRVKITAMTSTVAPGNNLNVTINTNLD